MSNKSHKWWTLAAVCFGLFMALLDVTIVNVALPTIQEDLNASFDNLQWVIDAYALAFAVVLVTSARLGDIFGRKKVFIIGMGIFTFGSLLCGLASDLTIGNLSNIATLNLARVVQGLGASAMMPLSLAIISTEFHGKERGTAFGIWGGVSGLATAIGPLIGGVLVEKVTWESIFYINIPIGIVGVAISAWAIKETRDEQASKSIDIFGLITLTISMFALLLSLMQGNDKGWSSTYIISLLTLSVVTFIIFVFGELRVKHPMVDPRLFKNLSFTGAAIAAFTLSGGLYALFFYLTLYLQNFLGFTALEAGLRTLALSGLVLIGAPLAGRFTDRLGPKPILVTALSLLAIAVFLMTRISPMDKPEDWVVLLPAFLIAGIGNGMANPPLSTLAMGTVHPKRSGMASGVNNVSRQIGIAFGIAYLGAILNHIYNNQIEAKISALSNLPQEVKAGMINGIQQAGPIAGSLGLHGNGTQTNPYADNPLFPKIAEIARTAFVDGTIDLFRFSAVLLAIGAFATLFLIKSSDMYDHDQQ